MLIFTLNKKNFQNLDFTSFLAVFNLMLQYRHKLFDDEYINGDKPYIERVYEIINAHVPYFWLFYDTNTLKVQGFCYFYDIIPHKNHIHTASASICFDKAVWGKPALSVAKKLLNQVFCTLNIYKIKAECYFDNYFMPNFLTKLGFRREAILKNETIVDNQPKNIEIWSIFNPAPQVHL